MTDNNKNVLNIYVFNKLMKVAKNPNNFESHKTSFLRNFFLFL